MINEYAWLYWKANWWSGLTENPGYMFLILQTACLIVIALWCLKNWNVKIKMLLSLKERRDR